MGCTAQDHYYFPTLSLAELNDTDTGPRLDSDASLRAAVGC